MRLFFSSFLFTSLLIGFASDSLPAGTEPDRTRPNVVLIMVDDMGYQGLSCFGNPYFKTPELDRLAADGMKLTDFHSSGTMCSPTRAGLLTGLHQPRTRPQAGTPADQFGRAAVARRDHLFHRAFAQHHLWISLFQNVEEPPVEFLVNVEIFWAARIVA